MPLMEKYESEVSSQPKKEVTESHFDDVTSQLSQNRWIRWIYDLDKFGVETRGIERVEPEDRSPKPLWYQFIHVMGVWFASNIGLTSMSLYFLPTLMFDLNLRDSLVPGLIGMWIGCLVPAYCSTMGPQSGCRQMVGARFLFGEWGVKFVSLIAIVGGVGWSVVNCVVGGQVLRAVGDENVPLAAGIIVIAVVSLIVAVFGIRVLMKFQTALSIPCVVAVILYYVVVCKQLSWISVTNATIAETNPNGSSFTTRGQWLSFFAISYSVTGTWGLGASDFYILFPEDTPKIATFFVTFLSIGMPTTLVAVVGSLSGAIAYSYKPWGDAYENVGVGGIIDAAFSPWGRFGKFCLVLLYISLICNNIMNTYSVAFEFQLIDNRLCYVPRWCWAVLVMAVYLVLLLVGRNVFSDIISNFLPMLGYWVSMYIVLLLEENLLFRNRSQKHLHSAEFVDPGLEKYLYNWTAWNRPREITWGIACCLAFCCGVIGAVAGMNQVYWVGWIARKIGDHGGDIGVFLLMGFTGVVYPPLRYLELRKFRK